MYFKTNQSWVYERQTESHLKVYSMQFGKTEFEIYGRSNKKNQTGMVWKKISMHVTNNNWLGRSEWMKKFVLFFKGKKATRHKDQGLASYLISLLH